jgi:NitT/TauT family transport system substrate-binding protein
MKRAPDQSHLQLARRTFFTRAGALGAASLFGLAGPARGEPPPEITRIRLVHAPATCFAPQYLAEELLRAEGFRDIAYVELKNGYPATLVETGEADVTQDAAPALVYALDSSESTVVLAGIHVGCYELFGNERVHSIRDLQGKTVAVPALGTGEHVLVSIMLAYLGIDPRKEVNWAVASTFEGAVNLFVARKADALVAFAPQPEELRTRGIGHVILNTALDRPWSQYFCCVLAANRQFARSYPVATKRALRAFLKAADLCAEQPERAAQYFVDKGYDPRYEVTVKLLKELSFNRWRQAHPEDTLRFHALRLHEVGMIKSTPERLIAQGTDWRFLNELKRELKA